MYTPHTRSVFLVLFCGEDFYYRSFLIHKRAVNTFNELTKKPTLYFVVSA